MTLYTYYLRPGQTALEDAVAVPERFSWMAFLFGGLWALYHGLWLVAVVLLAVPFLIGQGAEAGLYQPVVAAAAQIGFAVFVGCSANDWRRQKLERRGFLMAAVIAGAGVADADRRFFDSLRGRAAPGVSAAPEAVAGT